MHSLNSPTLESFLMNRNDKRLFLKTQNKREIQFLLSNLKIYMEHLKTFPHSLLVKFLGNNKWSFLNLHGCSNYVFMKCNLPRFINTFYYLLNWWNHCLVGGWTMTMDHEPPLDTALVKHCVHLFVCRCPQNHAASTPKGAHPNLNHEAVIVAKPFLTQSFLFVPAEVFYCNAKCVLPRWQNQRQVRGVTCLWLLSSSLSVLLIPGMTLKAVRLADGQTLRRREATSSWCSKTSTLKDSSSHWVSSQLPDPKTCTIGSKPSVT